MMSDFERGYNQGLEDGHRCERRHATLGALEKENAQLKAQLAAAIERYETQCASTMSRMQRIQSLEKELAKAG
jgi:phage shock protein A